VTVVLLVAALVGASVVVLRLLGSAEADPGRLSPPPARSSTPPAGPTVTVVAAADIACPPGQEVTREECRHAATADLARALRPDAVLLPGDLQYEDAAAEEFAKSYRPTWGRLRSITRPAPGNHEYDSERAKPYFDYFGRAAGSIDSGWYSFDLGAWHVIALNSNCDQMSGCGPGSDQDRWLRADLAANRARCTLAFWHHPRWNRGKYGDDDRSDAFVRALYDAGAEVVLTGHDHNYQRFEPRNPDGERDPARGVRQFVVGMGGRSLYSVDAGGGLASSTDDTFGVLSMTLRPNGYDWRFVAEPGRSFTDRGSGRCH
jgi:hypothetical protein